MPLPSPFNPRALVLASQSPRRLELLRQLGLEPEVLPAHLDERRAPDESAADYVERLASAKAEAVGRLRAALIQAEPARNPFVLGADTTVTLDERVLEKPTDPADARAMLRALSGREHAVLTAVALVDARHPAPRLRASCVVTTWVRFASLDDDTIARYVASGAPMDKAGAYGIQGAAGAFVSGLRGSYSNVVGLPLRETALLLVEHGAIPHFPLVTDP